MILPLLISLAVAAEPPADVRRPLREGAWVNWTSLQVEVEATAFDELLKGDSKLLEQKALEVVDARIGEAAALVPLTGVETLGAARPRVVQEAFSGARIDTASYYTSGRVKLLSVADIQPLASPWMVTRAPEPDASVASPGREGPTGVVIDARGAGVSPVYAPTIVGADDVVLFDGAVWKDAAFLRAPVVWVPDAMHPSAQVAGAEPAFFVATAGGPGRIVLGAADALRFHDDVQIGRAWRDGAVVILVDP